MESPLRPAARHLLWARCLGCATASRRYQSKAARTASTPCFCGVGDIRKLQETLEHCSACIAWRLWLLDDIANNLLPRLGLPWSALAAWTATNSGTPVDSTACSHASQRSIRLSFSTFMACIFFLMASMLLLVLAAAKDNTLKDRRKDKRSCRCTIERWKAK